MSQASPEPDDGPASTRRGFTHPVFDSQGVFRAAAMAMSRPGQLQSVCRADGDRLALPRLADVEPASLALLLALADLDTPIWLDERLRTGDLPAYLRFHTGAEITSERPAVSFALFASGYPGSYMADFAIGQDAYPELSTTLFIQVADLTSGEPRRVRGPGIETTATLRPAGLEARFWSEWRMNQTLYPCGLDVMLIAGHDLIGLPRSVCEEE